VRTPQRRRNAPVGLTGPDPCIILPLHMSSLTSSRSPLGRIQSPQGSFYTHRYHSRTRRAHD
jgi:hypothetical protein